MKFIACFVAVLAACVGLSQCFGAGMNQLTRQAQKSSITPLSFSKGGGLGGLSNFGGGISGFGSGASSLAALPSTTVGLGANARSYKNFYTHAYDESGFPRMLSASPQALASLAGGGSNGLAGLMSGALGRRR